MKIIKTSNRILDTLFKKKKEKKKKVTKNPSIDIYRSFFQNKV